MHFVLILAFLFWFVVAFPKCMCKSLEILGAPQKETSKLLLSRRTLCIAFWNCKVSRFLIGYFKLPLAPHIPDEFFFLSGNFWYSTEKAAILLLSWNIFKTYLFSNFVCSAKEASIFLFLRSTLYFVFSMCKVSWFLIVDFTLSLVTQTPRVKRLGVLQKMQRYWYGTLKNGLNLGWFWFVTAYKDSLHKT